jgi:hypothetical protein
VGVSVGEVEQVIHPIAELLPNYVAAVAAIVLLVITAWQIRLVRKDAQARTAYEFIKKYAEEASSSEILKYAELRPDFPHLSKFLESCNLSDERLIAVRRMASNLELLAISISHGAISEKFARDALGADFVRQVDYIVPFIEWENNRLETNTFGDSLITLAEKWRG